VELGSEGNTVRESRTDRVDEIVAYDGEGELDGAAVAIRCCRQF